MFANTTRCGANMFTLPPKFLVMNIAGTSKLSINLMQGICINSSLRQTALQGTLKVHKLTVMPFSQQYLIDVSVWGATFGFESITGSVNVSGITFSSCAEPPPKEPGKWCFILVLLYLDMLSCLSRNTICCG